MKFRKIVLLLLIFLIKERAIFSQYFNPIMLINSGNHAGLIRDIIATEDGKYLITASEDKTIRVWDVKKRIESRKILGIIGKGHIGEIYAMAISPDENFLAVSTVIVNNGIRIYDFNEGKLHKVLNCAHLNTVCDLSFSQDGKFMVSASMDKTVKLWDVKNNFKDICTIVTHKEEVNAVRIIYLDKEYFCTSCSSDRTIILSKIKIIEKSSKINSFEIEFINRYQYTNKLEYLAISKEFIATCGEDSKNILIFDHELNLITKIKNENYPAGIKFSPDGNLLLVGNAKLPTICHIYNTQDNFKRISSFSEIDNRAMAVDFLDNETAVVAGGTNNEIFIFDAFSGELEYNITGKGKCIWSVGLKKGLIYLGNTFSKIRGNADLEKYFNLKSSNVFNLKNKLESKFANCILPYFKSFSLKKGFKDQVLIVYDNEEEVGRIITTEYSGVKFNVYGFTKNGIVIAGSGMGNLHAYDVTGRLIANFIGISGETFCLAIKGNLLLSGGNDQILRLWDISELNEIETQRDFDRYERRRLKPVLNIFIADDNEWVAWDPEYYYNASWNGEKMIGYYVSRNKDNEVKFFDVNTYKHIYFRPDIVDKVIQRILQ